MPTTILEVILEYSKNSRILFSYINYHGFRVTEINKSTKLAPDFGSYSRRGGWGILEYSPLVATQKTSQKTSKIVDLFVSVTLTPQRKLKVLRGDTEHKDMYSLKTQSLVLSPQHFLINIHDLSATTNDEEIHD